MAWLVLREAQAVFKFGLWAQFGRSVERIPSNSDRQRSSRDASVRLDGGAFDLPVDCVAEFSGQQILCIVIAPRIHDLSRCLPRNRP